MGYGFLVRMPAYRDEPTRLYQAARLRVTFREKRRATGTLGPFTTVAHDGWDKSGLVVTATAVAHVNGHAIAPPLTAKGSRSSVISVHTDRTLRELNKVLRRIRPSDRDQIDGIDSKVAELQVQIASLRDERAALVHAAWRRGLDVRVVDVEPIAGDISRTVEP